MNSRQLAEELGGYIGIERQWYALHDVDPQAGALAITHDQALDANSKGFGVFWTVNQFNGARVKSNITKINAWAIEIDHGTKEEQIELIESQPIYPSLVIETKRGFHVYYHAKNASVESWDEIVSDRLVPFFKADPKARDLCRILRVPYFNHLKNPSDPFRVDVRGWSKGGYEEADIRYVFRRTEQEEQLVEKRSELRKSFGTDDDLWERVFQLDCELALERISGHRELGGEEFSFRTVSSGNLNILVGGKSTSCFIDQNKRIGSMDKGGPTIFDWIKWYGHSNAKATQIMKEVFPELFQGLKR